MIETTPSTTPGLARHPQRLLASVCCDLRLAWRNGFFVAAIFVSVIHLALLWWMQSILADWIVALVLLEICIFNGFYFAAALVLLGRAENTLLAQYLTPLLPSEWVIAKCLVLTLLAALECLVITLPVWDTDIILLMLAAALMTSLLCQLGLWMVQFYRSFSEFLMPSSLAFLFLLVPALQLADLWSSPWLAVHPLTPTMTLLKSSLTAAHEPAMAWWTLAALLWLVPGHWLATRSVRNMALAS